MTRKLVQPAMLIVITSALLILSFMPEDNFDADRSIALAFLVLLGVLALLHLFDHKRTIRAADRRQLNMLSGLQKAEVQIDALEQRLTEQMLQLRDAQNFMQSTIDSIPDATTIIDRDYHITSINTAARKSFAFEGDLAEPISCYRMIYGLDAPCDPTQRPCALLTGEASKKIESRVGDNGEELLVEIRNTPLRDNFGAVSGVIEVEHTLNENEEIALKLQRVNADAETAIRAKSEFLSTISHEVRTPMNAVLGMTDLLKLTTLTRKQQGYMQIIQSSGEMLLSLVDNVLDFSKLGAGQLVLQRSEFDVADLLERVLEIMGYQAYSKGLELAGTIEKDPFLRIAGDKDRLRQIMVNLVGNAIKFTNEGEVIISIGVDAAADGKSWLSVSVTDSGIGMSEETISRLFAPFPQVEQEALKQQRGSGLGLTISKQLVDSMGGEIGLESAPGDGTNASFKVPVDVICTADRDSTARTVALRNRRILVLDDNPRVAEIICNYMNAWGMSGEITTSADDALDRIRAAAVDEQPFDCAVIDAEMPGTDGISLARIIRADEDLSHLPIVLLTSIAKPLQIGEITSIGGIRCVNKPVLLNELRQNLFKATELDEKVSGGDVIRSDRDLRILIAEDNPVNRRLMIGMLKSLEYTADSVQDGPSVLNALEGQAYDVILMDCQMPGLDGDEVTREIRGNASRFRRQPIIVAVTADVSDEHKSKCLAAGMDDFLPKPIRLQTLVTGLNKWTTLLDQSVADSMNSANGAASPADQQALVHLRDRAGADGDAFLGTYIELFLQDTTSRLQILNAAIEHQDYKTLARESHALKGACLEFGLTELSVCCDALGTASREEHPDELSHALRRLTGEFERIRPIFEAEKNRSV